MLSSGFPSREPANGPPAADALVTRRTGCDWVATGLRLGCDWVAPWSQLGNAADAVQTALIRAAHDSDIIETHPAARANVEPLSDDRGARA